MTKRRHFFLLTLAMVVRQVLLLSDAQTRSRSVWSNDIDVSRDQKYERVPLIEVVPKSWRVNGSRHRPPDTSTVQKRHLEWFDSSSEDTQSADKEGFFENVFWEAESKEEEDKPETDHDLRQYYRKKYTKSHKILYPLLLAYKLKFFTMVPLLVGALTLLVGTTGLAGFFFALFAAAAGIPAKQRH